MRIRPHTGPYRFL